MRTNTVSGPMESLEGDAREIAYAARAARITFSSSPIPRGTIISRIASELDHAYDKHGRDRWGRHEFFAILKEEVDELWDGIKRDGPQNETEDEALQVAAMVFRYLETGDRYRKAPSMEPKGPKSADASSNPKSDSGEQGGVA